MISTSFFINGLYYTQPLIIEKYYAAPNSESKVINLIIIYVIKYNNNYNNCDNYNNYNKSGILYRTPDCG